MIERSTKVKVPIKKRRDVFLVRGFIKRDTIRKTGRRDSRRATTSIGSKSSANSGDHSRCKTSNSLEIILNRLIFRIDPSWIVEHQVDVIGVSTRLRRSVRPSGMEVVLIGRARDCTARMIRRPHRAESLTWTSFTPVEGELASTAIRIRTSFSDDKTRS